ncbi:transposase [Verrucomicrobiota bacterium]
MSRKLRVQFPGAIYHVTIRGVERRTIFMDDRDRERFFSRLADGVELDDVRIYMFCLMSNHAHLVVETPRANLDQFMHRLQTGYTVYFNLRHNRSGHLMQGRYGAVLVEGDEYLLNLSRYLHLNPVFVLRIKKLPLEERVAILRRYPWSTYRSYVGKVKRLDFVEYNPILSLMERKKSKQRAAYRRFVEAAIAESNEEFRELLKKARLSIGDEEFVARIRDLYLELCSKQKHGEDVLFRRQARTLRVEEIEKAVCEGLGIESEELRRHRKNSTARPVAARMLCKYAGLSQREVAKVLGLRTGAAVCTQLKRLDEAIKKSRKTKRTLKQIEKVLETTFGG